MNLKPDTDIDKLLSYAHALNFLHTLEKITYGTKWDFIADNMRNCLNQGIISEECSLDPIWAEHNITVQDLPKELEVYIEKHHYRHLRYSDEPKRYWGYGFKHVVLPSGWSLKMGCDCGRNINGSAFILFNGDNLVKTLAYFQVIENEKSGLERMMGFTDSLFDALEEGLDKKGDENLDQ